MSRSPNNLHLHPLPGRTGLPGPSLSFLASLSNSGAPLHSCNGLVFFRGSINFNGPTPFYVCNPTTRRCRRIPDAPVNSPVAIALYFDPSKDLHYKLVFMAPMGTQYQMLIYSSLTRSWRSSGKPFPSGDLYILGFTHAAICGGAVHWRGNRWRLVSFETHTEHLRITPFPIMEEKTTTVRDYYLGSHRDRLYLTVTPSYCISQILALNQDYSGWIPLYRINKLEVTSFAGPSKIPIINPINHSEQVCVLGLVEGENTDDGRLQDMLLLSHKTNHGIMITSYNLEEGCSDKVNFVPHDINPFGGNYHWSSVNPFAHSLYSP